MIVPPFCSRTRGRALLWALCLALFAHAGRVHADAPVLEPDGYRALIDQAFVEYDADHFPEARALFFRAHALYPSARAERSIGMLEFELRNYRDSARWLEHALASQVQPLTPELRGEVSELLARARGFIAQLHVSSVPSNVSVSVDGALESLDQAGTLLIEAGDHTLSFDAPGYAREVRMLKARGGDEHTWNVVLTPLEANAAPAALPSTLAPPEARRPRRWFVLPRFTLTLPGKGKYKHTCSAALCDASVPHEQKYDRSAAPFIGADVMFAATPALRIGAGMHTQLNETKWRFANGYESSFGRVFWFPITGEYRVRLSPALELPMRLSAGLSMVQAGADLKRVTAATKDACKSFSAQGVSCTSTGSPALGAIVAVGPGVAYALGAITLRGDLSIGYQWTRLSSMQLSGGGHSESDKQTDRTFIATLSVAAEL
ncbi:MAG: hypothetical protein JWN04_2173 [Myxococcaceae bacterium]|nr:hypothetical protein [Myxococcaceae bacterium]